MKKNLFKSKTLWMNLILAILAMAWPTANEYLTAHPEVIVSLFALVNMILRVFTKTELEL